MYRTNLGKADSDGDDMLGMVGHSLHYTVMLTESGDGYPILLSPRQEPTLLCILVAR